MEDLVIAGVELDERQGRITLFDVPDRPGYAARVFRRDRRGGRLRRHDRPERQPRTADAILSFTVPRDAVDRAAEAVRPIAGGQVSIEPALAKLSVIGVGMRTHTGVATRMFGALAERGDQHQPDQHQRGPHQRRHRRRHGPGRARCLRKAFALNGEAEAG